MMKLSMDNKPCFTKDTTVNAAGEINEQQELSLITRTATRDEDAFEALYSLYYYRLFRFIYRIAGRLDIIEEVINDVMYVVWEKAATYNQTCRLSTWIFGIAYNKSRNHKNLSTLQLKHDSIDDVSENLLPCGDDWIKKLETEDWLGNAFEVLSVEQRTVVELTYYHGMSYQEIAVLMDCPENTIKTRMFHARKKLASAL
jgi:RNA polymerase sigma-70 factor (ECF subfamily)